MPPSSPKRLRRGAAGRGGLGEGEQGTEDETCPCPRLGVSLFPTGGGANIEGTPHDAVWPSLNHKWIRLSIKFLLRRDLLPCNKYYTARREVDISKRGTGHSQIYNSRTERGLSCLLKYRPLFSRETCGKVVCFLIRKKRVGQCGWAVSFLKEGSTAFHLPPRGASGGRNSTSVSHFLLPCPMDKNTRLTVRANWLCCGTTALAKCHAGTRREE